MKRLPGFVLLFALGCSDGAELPPVEIGGSGGARLMTGSGKNPEESYEIAYAQLSKQHLNVRRALEPRGRNLYGASLSMQSILDAMERMRSLVTPAHQARFDGWIAKYREWQKQIERDTWGGSFLQDFEIAERRVKEAFNIDTVEFLQATPASPAPKETAPPAVARPVDPVPPKGTSTAIPTDKAVPPVVRPVTPAPDTQAAPVKPPERTPEGAPAPAPAFAGRMYFKAWQGFHDALLLAYKGTPRPDCRPKYEDLMETLKLLKASLAADRAQKLQIYIDYYSGVNEKTRTFTLLPEKTTDKDILDELEVVARVIRQEFNPDK
jgi:hypothetical protein